MVVFGDFFIISGSVACTTAPTIDPRSVAVMVNIAIDRLLDFINLACSSSSFKFRLCCSILSRRFHSMSDDLNCSVCSFQPIWYRTSSKSVILVKSVMAFPYFISGITSQGTSGGASAETAVAAG